MTTGGLATGLAILAGYDLTQRHHAILRNFPVVGHLRYLLESIGPELRQYIVTDNDDERPFTRDQRRWVYATAKGENTYFGFGTDNDLDDSPGYVMVKHATFPSPGSAPDAHDPTTPVPAAKIWGGPRGRSQAFRPPSIVNVAAMSYGSLSGAAIEALNRGSALAGCLHNTGEGGISDHHRHGGPLIWQIGTGYFGCRDAGGHLDLERLVDTAASAPVVAIELKLSQGAKPGLGGLLPATKVTPEIAAIRGVPEGQDCTSPPFHSAFRDVDELLDLVEEIADRTGVPVGIKAAVGQLGFWEELADAMAGGNRGVDHITVDGGEGGTGAAPLAFSDHVSLPFKVAFPRVYRVFAERGLDASVLFIGSGKLGLPESGVLAMAMGVDMVHVAREAMLAVGCIQAQRCHTGRCPTGVATQSQWLAGGLDPASKSVRCANYIVGLRHELVRLALSCGVVHPALVTLDHVELLDSGIESRSAREVFGYREGWGLPSMDDRLALVAALGVPPEAAAPAGSAPAPTASPAREESGAQTGAGAATGKGRWATGST